MDKPTNELIHHHTDLPLTVKEFEKVKTDNTRMKDHQHQQCLLNPINSYQQRPHLHPPVHPAFRQQYPANIIPSVPRVYTTLSSKKVISSSRNRMDFVPSPSFMPFAASPHHSIYEQEKAEGWNNIPNSSGLSHQTQEQWSEEMCVLDDKIEDSSLQNLFTPDMMNSIQTSSTLTKEVQWGGKPAPINTIQTSTSSLRSTPTLAELNMETDLTLVSEIVSNLDSDENSALDFLCNTIRFSSDIVNSVTPGSLNSTQPSSCFTTLGSPKSFEHDQKVSSDSMPYGQQKTTDTERDNFLKSYSSLRKFPPRASQPTLVGIVSPVKKENDQSVTETLKASDKYIKPQDQSPHLYELLKQQDCSIVKSEHPVFISMMNMKPKKEVPAQIVPPSSCATKRSLNGTIKIEPASPQREQVLYINEESIEEKWKDIEHFIHEEPEIKKRKRCDSGGSGHTSDDDGDDNSQFGGKYADDSDYDDYSDIDEDITCMKPSEHESLVAMGKKQKQYFWQYNVQSKGPKGTRLKLAVESPRDPHVLNDFEDPVFDECNTQVAGIRHGGKARKGDGNEISPNPKKLCLIGHQLLRLNKQINACQLGPDVPALKRTEARKEKNKLASRACRLKKKAQHEANKIKLYGLEREHSQLNSVIDLVWPLLREKAKACMSEMGKSNSASALPSSSESLSQKLDTCRNDKLKMKAAGKTVDYVNNVILKVESGDSSGGLDIRKTHKT